MDRSDAVIEYNVFLAYMSLIHTCDIGLNNFKVSRDILLCKEERTRFDRKKTRNCHRFLANLCVYIFSIIDIIYLDCFLFYHSGNISTQFFLAYLSRRLRGERTAYAGLRCPSVARPLIFSNDFFSEAVRPILSILNI